MTGTTIAQAIPILLTPILTRLYSPDDFGVLALFMAICLVFGSVASGRFELAIPISKDKVDALNIAFLGLVISAILALIVFVNAIFFRTEILNMLGEPKLDIWLYFFPAVIIFLGAYNVFNYLNIRDEKYNLISKSHVFKATCMSGTQLSLGFNLSQASGLIIGYIFGQFVLSFKLAKPFINKKNLLVLNKKKLLILFRRYRDFFYYSSLSALLNVGSQQIPIILLGLYFSASIAGFYSVAARVLILPINVIGNSFGQVFFQKTSKCDSIFEVSRLTKKIVSKLIAIGFVPFSLVLVFGDKLSYYILGSEWELAGVYMQYFSPWLYFVFITSPITNVYATLEKQKLPLIFNSLSFFLRVISIVLGYLYFEDANKVVILFGFVSFILWFSWHLFTLNVLKIKLFNQIILALIPICVLSSIIYFFRYSYGI